MLEECQVGTFPENSSGKKNYNQKFPALLLKKRNFRPRIFLLYNVTVMAIHRTWQRL